MPNVQCIGSMRSPVLCVLGMAVCACQPAAEPSLSISSDRGSFDGRMQRALVTVTAADRYGPGQGTVSLVAGVGEFVEGPQARLVDGQATVTYRCDPELEAACQGTVVLGATWGTISSSMQIKVTPSTPVVPVKWRVMPTHTLETLNDVVVGPGHAYWAVGTMGTVLRVVNDEWFSVPSGVDTTLTAAWSDGTRLVIVGTNDTFLVWNGSELVPQPLDGYDDFTAVTGNATSVVAVTTQGRLARFDGATVAFEWLGQDVLRSVAQSNAGEVWVLGEKSWYRSTPTTWAPVAPPVLGNWRTARFGPDGLWVVGARDTDQGVSGVVLNGPTPDWRSSAIATELIRDIFFVDGSDERFAVSDTGVFRKPGSSAWEAVETPMGGLAVAGRSATDVMVVGQGGVSIHRIQ